MGKNGKPLLLFGSHGWQDNLPRAAHILRGSGWFSPPMFLLAAYSSLLPGWTKVPSPKVGSYLAIRAERRFITMSSTTSSMSKERAPSTKPCHLRDLVESTHIGSRGRGAGCGRRWGTHVRQEGRSGTEWRDFVGDDSDACRSQLCEGWLFTNSMVVFPDGIGSRSAGIVIATEIASLLV